MREFSAADENRPLTMDLCREWLVSKIFRFRPEDYTEKFPKWPGMVGLEVEMLPFSFASQKIVPLYGKGSSSEILLSEKGASWDFEYIDDAPQKGLLRVKLGEGDQITFEPGGQIEFSSKPYPCLSDALLRTQLIQEKLTALFKQHGVSLSQSGINPWQTVDDIGLQMTKSRYRAMNDFFLKIGPYGPRMMRQTCTVQVNLDFGSDETTLAKRYLCANLLSPVATALFANSPFYDGKSSEYSSYRARVWQGLDDSRTGFPDLSLVASKLTLNSCVSVYLDFLLSARLVFIEKASYKVQDSKVRFKDWLNGPIDGVSPTLKDFDTHLSLHFPEVRPRGFLELRSVDCTPSYWQEIPAIFYTALLYDEKCLDASLDILLPKLGGLKDLLVQSAYGLRNDELYEMTGKLVDLVVEGFSRLPPCFQGEGSLKKLMRYMELYPKRRKTPADDLRPLLAGGGGIEIFSELENRWRV